MLSPKINIRNYIWAILLLGAYSVMIWGVEREEFLLYFSLFSVTFLFHFYPLSRWSNTSRPAFYIGIGMLIRLMAISAFPTLSEDIYRYIWDGYLTQSGISPYKFTPNECIQMFSVQDHPVLHYLYPHLNSATYYSVYPPVAQGFFTFGGWLASTWGITIAIIGLKSLFLLTELCGWACLFQLFQIHKLDQRWFWALWINPLLILEWNFSGHIESLATSFLLISVFIQKSKKNYLSGFLLALAVLVKLWPLLFAPLFLKHLDSGIYRIKWTLTFIIAGIIGSIPLFLHPEYFQHFKGSLDLYFRTFEFNASIYYVFRALGTWWYGYNPISIIGPLCSVMMAGLCIWLYVKKRVSEFPQLIDSIQICGIIYLLFATTVHPWYLTVLLPLAYFNKRISLIIWSYLIFISYHAYSYMPVTENSFILIFTYFIVILLIMIEWNAKKNSDKIQLL